MGEWVARTPQWVTPQPTEVDDFHWLVYRLAHDTGREWLTSAGETIAWVRGGRPAPITHRDETPVTAEHARAELWAALAAMDRTGPEPPYLDVARRPNVTPWPIAGTPTTPHGEGAWRTLRWLLGDHNQPSPIPLPLRQPTGEPVTTEQIITAALTAYPVRYAHTEARRQLDIDATNDARRYRDLIALIDETRVGCTS